MNKYVWKNDNTKMLRMLRNSRTLKEKYGWSYNIGAGFIREDIKEVMLNEDNTITISFFWPHTQTFETKDLNLRETEELIDYLDSDKWTKFEDMRRKTTTRRGRPAS